MTIAFGFVLDTHCDAADHNFRIAMHGQFFGETKKEAKAAAKAAGWKIDWKTCRCFCRDCIRNKRAL